MIKNGILADAVPWNRKSVFTPVLLTVLPNLLGMINIAMPRGFQWHCFQSAIFFAAALFGPLGGLR